MEKIINLDNSVLSFVMDEFYCYCLSENIIYKYSLHEFKLIKKNEIFTKKGLSRALLIDNEFLYCRDFYSLYVLDKNTLQQLNLIQLGNDLSSDICGITSDDNYIYACIRNGDIAKISKQNLEKIQFLKLSNSSIWSIKVDNNYLYAGNVEGELLKIDKENMEITQKIKPHKQNLKSIIIDGNEIITASQDKTITIIDLDNFNVKSVYKKLHNKMFFLGGVWRKRLITSSFPCGEIKVWDKGDFSLINTIEMPKALSGRIIINNDTIYLSSRKINGIVSIDINKL